MENTIKNTVSNLVSIQIATKLLGLSKQAIYYRLGRNIDHIADYCFIVFGGNINSATRWSRELSQMKDGGKRYFFEKSYIDGTAHKETVSQEEEVEFSDLYYRILDIIENKLEKEKKSIATEQQKWANMKIVDMEICGEIFSRYREREGEPLEKVDKSVIRTNIKRGYSFTHPRLIRIAIESMREFLDDLEDGMVS